MSSTRPSSQDLSSLASRRRASSRSPAASAPPGDRDATPSLPPVERGAKVASSVLQGQMFEKTVGGGKSGEKPRRPNLFTDTTSVLPEAKVDRKTPRNVSFALLLTTKAMIRSGAICGGAIKSSSDAFCAKEECLVSSHSKKHALFGPNRVFLVSSSATSTNITRRVIEPEKFHLEVEDPRNSRVMAILQIGSKSLESVTNLEDAAEVFSRVCDEIAAPDEVVDGVSTASSAFADGVALSNVAGGDMAYSSVAEAWDKEFPDSEGEEPMSSAEATIKMASLFELDAEDVEAEQDVEMDVKLSSKVEKGEIGMTSASFEKDKRENVGDIFQSVGMKPRSFPSSFVGGVKYEPSGVSDLKTVTLELNNVKSILARLDLSTSALVSKNTDLTNELVATKGALSEMKTKLGANQLSLNKLEATVRVMKSDLEIEKQKSVTSRGKRFADVLDDLVKDLEGLKRNMAADKSHDASMVISDMLKDMASPGYKMLRQSVVTSVKSTLRPMKSIIEALPISVADNNAAIEALWDEVDKLVISHTATTSGLGVLQDKSTSSSSHTGLQDITEQVSDLKFMMEMMTSRLGTDAVQYESVLLQSFEDTFLFVTDHVEPVAYGCFVDMVALLDVLRDGHIDVNTFVQSQHNTNKAQYKSVDEALISLSFLHVTPTVFSNTKHNQDFVAGSLDKVFHTVKKRSSWCDQGGRLGLKKDLVQDVSTKASSLKLEIRRTLGNSKGAELALAYLNESHQCFNEFVNWTEDFFLELKAISDVSDDDAWTLVLECWLAFFRDLRMVRSECSSISLNGVDPMSDERRKIVAQYIWTMARSIKIQQDYREALFRNHPSIATVINYHLFQHRVPLTKYERELGKLESDLKAMVVWKANTTRDIKTLQAKK